MKRRRPTQHIRRYRSGKHVLVNKGIRYYAVPSKSHQKLFEMSEEEFQKIYKKTNKSNVRLADNTRFEYDNHGDIQKRIDPDGTISTFSNEGKIQKKVTTTGDVLIYDKEGNLKEKTSRDCVKDFYEKHPSGKEAIFLRTRILPNGTKYIYNCHGTLVDIIEPNK